MEFISSNNNHKIKEFLKLRNNKKNIERSGLFLIEGKHLIEEAIKNNLVEELLIIDADIFSHIDVKKILVTNNVIEKLSLNQTNNGVIAICSYKKLIPDLKKLKRIIVLDGINNPGNFGTIIRTARAFGFDAVLTINDSVFPYNDKVIKASQGALFNFPVFNVEIKDIKDLFIPIHFVFKKNSKNMESVEQPNSPYALVFGNEANGISDETLFEWDGKYAYINLNKEVESLNIAAAAAIAIHKFK